MALHQGHLRYREQERQRQEAERLEAHPGIGRDIPPDELVQCSHGEEEQGPAHWELAPAFLAKIERRTEQGFEHRLLSEEPSSEQEGEHRIDDGRLELDEGLVAQIEREPTEDE